MKTKLYYLFLAVMWPEYLMRQNSRQKNILKKISEKNILQRKIKQQRRRERYRMHMKPYVQRISHCIRPL